jgi:hypothetical protein
LLIVKEVIGSFSEFEELVRCIPIPRLFLGQANALHPLMPGIGRPHPEYVPTPELERALISQFKARAVPHLDNPAPASQWEWLICAQHYGLKTRLLDWTTDWRVALYFAALPHEEMRRVPFSVFIYPESTLTTFDALPLDPYTLHEDVYFQPPHLNERIGGQAAYLSAHRDPYTPVAPGGAVQFSFFPDPESRRSIAEFLAASRITSAELMPGLDGICRSLVEQPRITAQVKLETPPAMVDEDFRPIPASAIGKRVGSIRKELIATRRLRAVLEYRDAEKLLGIPCFLGNKLFGHLKYANRANCVFHFISADGLATKKVRSTDEEFDQLRLKKEHVEQLFPTEMVVIRKISAEETNTARGPSKSTPLKKS